MPFLLHSQLAAWAVVTVANIAIAVSTSYLICKDLCRKSGDKGMTTDDDLKALEITTPDNDECADKRNRSA
jgi:hypothetical protein